MRPADTWKDYELLDATDGNRLERWGETLLVRPDPQVVWKTPQQSPLWARADAVYHRSNQGGGEWEYRRRLPEKWKITCGEGEDKLTLIVSPTGFKHTGVFPEQAVNWACYAKKIRAAGRPIKVLNLFGYTGGATLACAAAGATVCHVRFLKVGDMQLRTPQAATRLYYADRVHKKDAEPLGIGNGFEAVVPGFYRQFEGEVVLTSGQNTLGIEKVYKTVTEILKDLHAYSMLVLLSQTFFYSKAAPAWLESIMKLLAELKPQFESGRLALVRLGKNTGAESKTIHMPDDAPDALPGRFKTGASTAYITSDADEKFGAQPFGWAILEADPAGDVQALKEWCARHACEELPAALSKEWQFIADLRAERKALLDKTAAEEADLIRRRQEAEKAEEAAQRAKAAMSPERRAAVEICEALAKFPGIVQPGTLLFDRVKLLLEEALSWTNAEDKKQLALQIQPLMKKKDMYRGKAERLFKSQLKTLRGEG